MLNSVGSGRRHRKTIVIQRIVIFVLCVAITAVSFGYFSQMRLNRFSKNIIFSDNYFLRNFALAYSSQASPIQPSIYTVSEVEAIMRELVKESGLKFFENIEISLAYRPDREFDRFDILSYYYNYMLQQFASTNELYVLFSPEIHEVIAVTGTENETDFSQYEVISNIEKLVEKSFEWTPSKDMFVRGEIIYMPGAIKEEMEVFYDPSYEEYLTGLKNKIVSSAIHKLDDGITPEAEYTAEDICLLYYDSIAENMLDSYEYLPAQKVFDLLEKYEYGKIRPRILDAEHISQLPDYPNGCEAVSAVMLLKYAGYNAKKSDFIENYLEKGEMKIRFGIRFGPDPAEKYAGDPSSVRGGWGCFAPAIVNALELYLAANNSSSHTAFNVSGASLQVLCETFIDRSIPVAVWITQDYSPVSEVYQWLDYDSNQVYLYPKNQHCVMLIGYDKDYYYVCDPLKDENYTMILRADAELSYTSIGSQAVVLMPNGE